YRGGNTYVRYLSFATDSGKSNCFSGFFAACVVLGFTVAFLNASSLLCSMSSSCLFFSLLLSLRLCASASLLKQVSAMIPNNMPHAVFFIMPFCKQLLPFYCCVWF